MQKVAVLTGHSSRVLHLASSPDGESIVTGAGDETLRFWNVFPKNQKDQENSELFWNVSQLR
jgi:cell division cycle 20-like protein 1 (cofactor of APC complex)